MQLVSYRNTMRNAVNLRHEREIVRELAERRRQEELDRRRANQIDRQIRLMEQRQLLLVKERAEARALLEKGRQAARLYRMSGANADSLEKIIRRICKATGVHRRDFLSSARNPHIVLAKHAVMYWACRRTTLSLTQIGAALGGRDHTTILHGKRKHVERRAKMGRTLPEVR